jgi:hypothetical protein
VRGVKDRGVGATILVRRTLRRYKFVKYRRKFLSTSGAWRSNVAISEAAEGCFAEGCFAELLGACPVRSMVDDSVRPLVDEFNVDARRLFRRLVAAMGIDAHHASL